MNKHTPGPWFPYKNKVNHTVCDARGDLVCRIDGSAIPAVDARLKADARLIASAPDLLQALISLHCVARVDRDESYAAVTNAAAVIAKATGEQP